jgi:autophagy-related protein 13
VRKTNTQGPSPGTSGAAVAARRLSGHSIHPFTSASPSTSNLRGSPSYAQGPSPTLAPRPSVAHPSSIGRTSSFLSQSGRSFTHAQLAHMYTGSTSPPVTGAMSREHLPLGTSPQQPLVSPTSLSFSKQPLPRTSSARQPSYTGQSPFIPSSLERDNSMPPPSSTGHGSIPKRYPSSLSTSQGQRRVSYGSSAGEAGSAGGSHGQSQNLLRRSSTRMSTESGLRHSLEKEEQVNVPDNDDIQSFLKTLDTLPQPPSLAAQASRARIPSASSSLSNTSVPQQSPTSTQSNTRAPVTRAQVDDAVRRMTGSFAITTKVLEGSSVMPRTTSPGSGPAPAIHRAPSVGLLSASRPSTAPRRVSPASLAHGPSEGITTGSGSVKRNSPLSGAPFQPPPLPSVSDQAAQTALPPSPPPLAPTRSKSAARSLPAGPGPVADPSIPPHPRSGFLSPQPTGSGSRTEDRPSSQRRGPVLLRGGFEGRSQSTAHQRLSTSPSRSPIRDYPRLGTVSGFAVPRSGSMSTSAGTGQGESQAEAELIGWRRYRSEQRIANRVENHEKEVEGMRRQSAGAGDVLEESKSQGGGKGGLTAPSSLGRSRSRDADPGGNLERD